MDDARELLAGLTDALKATNMAVLHTTVLSAAVQALITTLSPEEKERFNAVFDAKTAIADPLPELAERYEEIIAAYKRATK